MSKNKKIILIVLIFAVFLGVFFLTLNKLPFSSPLVGGGRVGVNLSFKDTIPGSFAVYDFMRKLQNEGKINFTEKDYPGMGKLITAINGVKSDGNQSWIYYVNGTEAQVGVSNYKIKQGDIVSWKYERSNF